MSLPPDGEIIERAKGMLLTFKGMRLGNGMTQNINMSAERAERLVALAMLGLDIRAEWERESELPEDVRAWLAPFMEKWVEKTNLLVGTIIEDKKP